MCGVDSSMIVFSNHGAAEIDKFSEYIHELIV